MISDNKYFLLVIMYAKYKISGLGNLYLMSLFNSQYQFVFDEAFGEGCSNKEIYERTAKPLIKTVFNRYLKFFCTIM